jgi:mono/diheme cytochrome c family protein
VLLALSSSQKLVIALAAAAFVVFALVSSMVIPRSRPGFPGKHVGWFIAVAVLFTVGMLATVAFVAKETGEEEHAAGGESTLTTGSTESTPSETTTTETTSTETTSTETTSTETTSTEGGSEGSGDPAAGKTVFATAGCESCHTLADAGSTGTVGPNLDDRKPSYDKVVERVTEGKSPMPSFKGTLTPQQIQDVAAYVSSVTRS